MPIFAFRQALLSSNPPTPVSLKFKQIDCAFVFIYGKMPVSAAVFSFNPRPNLSPSRTISSLSVVRRQTSTN
jgi:hypothetical protein